jgi:hypothetical protein
MVLPEPVTQLGECPPMNQTEVAPIVMPTGVLRDNQVGYDFGRIL